MASSLPYRSDILRVSLLIIVGLIATCSVLGSTGLAWYFCGKFAPNLVFRLCVSGLIFLGYASAWGVTIMERAADGLEPSQDNPQQEVSLALLITLAGIIACAMAGALVSILTPSLMLPALLIAGIGMICCFEGYLYQYFYRQPGARIGHEMIVIHLAIPTIMIAGSVVGLSGYFGMLELGLSIGAGGLPLQLVAGLAGASMMICYSVFYGPECHQALSKTLSVNQKLATPSRRARPWLFIFFAGCGTFGFAFFKFFATKEALMVGLSLHGTWLIGGLSLVAACGILVVTGFSSGLSIYRLGVRRLKFPEESFLTSLDHLKNERAQEGGERCQATEEREQRKGNLVEKSPLLYGLGCVLALSIALFLGIATWMGTQVTIGFFFPALLHLSLWPSTFPLATLLQPALSPLSLVGFILGLSTMADYLAFSAATGLAQLGLCSDMFSQLIRCSAAWR